MKTLEELLAEYRTANEREVEASREAIAFRDAARKAVIEGQTTGDRQHDLAIVLRGKCDRAAGQQWFEFEQAIQQSPGELLLVVSTWEENMIKHIFDTGSGMMATIHSYVVCLISSQNPMLGFEKKYGTVTLPIDRYLTIREGRDQWSAIQECAEPVTLGEVTMGIHWESRFPGEGTYFVGNKSVAAQIDSIFWNSSEEVASIKLFSLMGIEHFGPDGQGKLAIPRNESA